MKLYDESNVSADMIRIDKDIRDNLRSFYGVVSATVEVKYAHANLFYGKAYYMTPRGEQVLHYTVLIRDGVICYQ